MDDQILELKVSRAGECKGPDRIARATRSGPLKEQPTTEERALVLSIADEIMEKCLKPTPRAVRFRLKKKQRDVAMERIRSILRARRRAHGNSTQKFRESVKDVQECVDKLDPARLVVKFLQFAPWFGYVALMMPFIFRMRELQPSRICLAADFTFRVELLGYVYGLICDLDHLLRFSADRCGQARKRK